jgi:hypothetical protein
LTKQASSKASLEALYVEVRRLDELAKAEKDRVDGLFAEGKSSTNNALVAQKDSTAAALAASEKAVNKAEDAQKVVNTGQNEFRATLKDQAATLMPRSETENLIRELRGLISAQGEVITGLRSRLDIGPPSLGVLQARSDQNQGRMSGWNDVRLLAAIVIAAAGLYLAFVRQ